jgi:hypothetical protein
VCPANMRQPTVITNFNITKCPVEAIHQNFTTPKFPAILLVILIIQSS